MFSFSHRLIAGIIYKYVNVNVQFKDNPLIFGLQKKKCVHPTVIHWTSVD